MKQVCRLASWNPALRYRHCGLEIVEPLAYPFKGMYTHTQTYIHTRCPSDARTCSAFDVHT